MKVENLAALVLKAHCPRCAGYEDRVMRRLEGEALPESVRPCDAFNMSDRFRDWAVSRMRSEVGGQISAAGLDRMAILRERREAAATERPPEQAQPGHIQSTP